MRGGKRGGEEVNTIIIHIHPSCQSQSPRTQYHTHNHTSPTLSHIHTISSHSTLLRPAIYHISASDVHLHHVVEALAVHDGGGGADEDTGDDEGTDAVVRSTYDGHDEQIADDGDAMLLTQPPMHWRLRLLAVADVVEMPDHDVHADADEVDADQRERKALVAERTWCTYWVGLVLAVSWREALQQPAARGGSAQRNGRRTATAINEYCEYAASAVYIIHVFYMNEILLSGEARIFFVIEMSIFTSHSICTAAGNHIELISNALTFRTTSGSDANAVTATPSSSGFLPIFPQVITCRPS
eukprot:SAG25_NODE_1257_length_3483_cov_3.658392_3_plen_299_part_00